MRMALLLLGVLAVACGPEPVPQLSSQFTGRWLGTIDINAKNTLEIRNAAVDMVASGDEVVVRALCPDATGIITASGAGGSASWAGDLSCPLPSTDCPDQTVHYGTLSIQLVSDHQVNITGAGVLIACHVSTKISVVFQGTK